MLSLLGLNKTAVGQTPSKIPPGTGTVQITAALVDQEMQIHPVPLYGLVLTSTRPDTVTTRTGVDGKALILVPAGSYTLSGIAPALFQGQRYSWNISMEVEAGRTVEITL